MKDNYKNTANRKATSVSNKIEPTYSYYSKVLQKPFDTITELEQAECVYYAELKAKEDKAATKKADASKVEAAFKNMNQARRDYKENILKLTDLYQKELRDLKNNFESEKGRIQSALADAENTYSTTLKAFTDKYPEGYHLTLKDGDFETVVDSSSAKTSEKLDNFEDFYSDFFRWIFGI